MAQENKISELEAAGTIDGTELLPLVQSGTTVKGVLSNVYNYFKTAYDTVTTTITNKRITKRVYSSAYDPTLTIASDSYDCAVQTAVGGAIVIANPTGTPTSFQSLEIILLDDGTNRGITWGANFIDLTSALPSTTTANKRIYAQFTFLSAKWYCVNVQIQP